MAHNYKTTSLQNQKWIFGTFDQEIDLFLILEHSFGTCEHWIDKRKITSQY